MEPDNTIRSLVTKVKFGLNFFIEMIFKKMFAFLIDNIFVAFGNQDFQQFIGILMGTNCVPL